MITFKELFEAKDSGGHGSEKHHVMSFARMNPPTTGHMEVVNKLHAVAKEHNAPHSLIVSHSNDAKKNPLTAEQKVKHLKRYSPETNVKAASKESPTILHHAAALHKSGVQHLHVVAGSDRHKEMHDLLHKYNTGEEHKHGSFKFKSITMHSSGERDPDSEGTTGMSGTKMRQHAHENNFAEFRKGVPSHVSDKHAHELMKDVRHGSGIKEETISYQTFMEVRMSAAVKLQRAFEREQQKSAASRERAKQLLAPKKPEPVKEHIEKVAGGYEVESEHGNKNLGKSSTLAGAKKRLKQVEYFKHMKEEDMQFTESVHDNRTGFAKKKREDDEGGELYRHTYKYNVSKPGVNDGKKHERHVTTPLTPRPKHEIEHLARAHLTKQGYQIHEGVKETPTGRVHTKDDYEGYPSTFKDKEETKLKNSQDRHRMNRIIPANDKIKEEAGDKRGAYEKKSPVVIAPKDPKAKTYGKIVSKIRTMAEEAEEIEEATPYYNKPSFLKKMGRVAKQERLAREKKEAEAKKPVKEETMEEGATGAKPGWMLRQDPVLAKKVKDSKRGHEALKKWAGKMVPKDDQKTVKEETQENTMGLKSFITLVKEGTLQSSGDDSIPTLTDAPAKKKQVEEGVMDTVKKVAKKAAEVLGGPDDEGHKKDLQKKMGVPQTGKVGMAKQNEEVESLEEGLDPSEIAGNPRMYSADSAKKAYYHKSATASDKESLARHLDRHHGNKNWRKPVKEEAEVIEEANHREFASQGKMHPDMAKHMKTGQETDFYHSKTGDKISGVVKHTTGGEVHIKAHKEGKMGAGDVHKFKVSSTLDEASKHVAPTNKKPAIDIDKVNAAGQEPHEETFETHKKVKKESFSVSDLLQALKEGMWPGTPEYKAKFDGAKQGGGSGIKKGSSYGGSLQKDEPDHDEEPATAGRKVGSKSGARKNLGNSKLHK